MTQDPKKVIDDLYGEMSSDFGSFIEDLEKNLTAQTPKESGRAKRGWKVLNKPDLSTNDNGAVIENRVPYIGVLDSGSSRQAPDGIVEPAIRRTNARR